MNDCFYRGYRIDSYHSPRHQFRWISEEDDYIETVAEFNLEERFVSVEDCKRIIDSWLDKGTKAEQLSLF